MKMYEKRWHWFGLLAAIVLIACFFIHVPYFVQAPGKAQSMNHMIRVSGGQKIHGAFSLVYIYLGQANIYQYIGAKFDRNKYTTLIREDEVKLPGQNDRIYNQIQDSYMKNAQQTAAYVACRAAGKKAQITGAGVLVLGVIQSMPNARVLRGGDVITGLENRPIRSIADLQKQILGKKLGDRIQLIVKRDGRPQSVSVRISRFPSKSHAGVRQGIGIYQDDYLRVHTTPSVQFNIHNIGGPSAGLMMALNIYDQLNGGDLAAGRTIAGTGTIDLDGRVGPIGGIREKVVGADRSKIDLFFAPVADHEYNQAKETAREIHSSMKIIPVRTFNEAVRYLQNHPD